MYLSRCRPSLRSLRRPDSASQDLFDAHEGCDKDQPGQVKPGKIWKDLVPAHRKTRVKTVLKTIAKICKSQWIGLGENLQESPILMGKSMVSCRFSLKPIHWKSRSAQRSAPLQQFQPVYRVTLQYKTSSVSNGTLASLTVSVQDLPHQMNHW